MTSAFTMTGASAAPIRVPRLFGLYVLLVLVAVVEAFEGLASAPILFGDMSDIPGPGIGGALIKAHIAGHPVLALTALVCAAVGNVRYAIIALGALMVMTWLNYMPSVLLHGLDFGGIATFQTIAQIVAFPLMAACAIALAARTTRLALAATLVSIPTLFGVLGGVAVNGF